MGILIINVQSGHCILSLTKIDFTETQIRPEIFFSIDEIYEVYSTETESSLLKN